MLFRQRSSNSPERSAAPSSPTGAAGAPLAHVQSQGQRHLDAGEEAIERALSGNSEQFVRDSVQTGGQ